MKNILFIILSAFIMAFSSGCSDTPQADLPTPKNYVVLLDLSDRLLQPSQVASDKAIIKTVFEAFEHTVRTKNMIVNSKDKFRIVIAPQKGISYEANNFMNQLFIDMETVNIAQKRKILEGFTANWESVLEGLYQKATLHKKNHNDFAGCDLWKYFNEQLDTDLLKGYDNRLVILTDGYLDFESNPNIKHSANRSTATNFISALHGSPNWKKTFKTGDYGIIPTGKNYPPTSVLVTEIAPKSNNLDESEIITTIWGKWMSEMRFRNVNMLLRSTTAKTKMQMASILKG